MAYRSDEEAMKARAAALAQEIETTEQELDAVRHEVAEHRDRADRVEREVAAIRRRRKRSVPWPQILVVLVVVALPLLIGYLVHGR